MIAGVKVVFWRFVYSIFGCDFCDWCMCATGKIRNNNGNKTTTGNKQRKDNHLLYQSLDPFFDKSNRHSHARKGSVVLFLIMIGDEKK
jgi:hypothetical protein